MRFLTPFVVTTASYWMVSSALQQGGVSSNRIRSRTVVQSARSYSLPQRQWQQPQPPLSPFIRPLLQDFHRDFMHDVMSQDRSSNQDNQREDDETDDMLDFLPWYVLQDETKQCMTLITKATRQYIYGDTRGDPKVNAQELLQVIQDEYKSADVPFVIGNCTYGGGADPNHRTVAQILSFAAFHRLPAPITAVLLANDDLEAYQQAFLTNGGWAGVSFPRGLAIRLPRNRLTKKLERYQPIPRRFFSTRNVRIAEKCVKEAARVQAPPRQLLSRQGFLESLERELKSSAKPWHRRGVSPFFPSQRNVFKFWQRHVIKASALLRIASMRLKQYVRATILSYASLAFIWYNLSLLWQWQRLSVDFCLASSAFPLSLQRVGGVITHVYSDLHVVVVPVLFLLAVGLAPLANRALQGIRDRLGVADDNRALLLLSSFLAVSHLGIGASILFLDAAILRAVVL